MPTRVLIVDDHAVFRARARRALEAAGWSVVGEAEDGAGGLEAAGRLEPDVVLLDVQLPDVSGVEVARRLTDRETAPAVVLISTRDAQDVAPIVARSGARGFVPKARLSAIAVAALL